MAPKKAKKKTDEDMEEWAKSEAKRVLMGDIISGLVKPSMKPKQVHESRPLFKEWPLAQFQSNLGNL